MAELENVPSDEANDDDLQLRFLKGSARDVELLLKTIEKNMGTDGPDVSIFHHHPIAFQHVMRFLNETSPLTYFYMEEDSDEAKNEHYLLRTAILILCEKIKTENALGRKQHLKGYFAQLNKALHFIALFELFQDANLAQEEKKRLQALIGADKPAQYLGFELGRWFSDRVMEFTDAKSRTVRDWMTDVNGWRLYWVWAGGFLNTLIGLVPNDFFNALNAQKAGRAPSPINGHMSWSLYFTRFSIEMCLLLKNTIKTPQPIYDLTLLSVSSFDEIETNTLEQKLLLIKADNAYKVWGFKDDKWQLTDIDASAIDFTWENGRVLSILASNPLFHILKEAHSSALDSAEGTTWQERFKGQWQQRKFILLNDAVWGIVNLVTFVWLCGAGKLGYAGNVLTAGLLLVDLALLSWSVYEERARHFAFMTALDNQIDNTTDDAEKALLINLKAQEEKTFRYQQYKHINSIVYSCGLIIGFSLLVGLYMTPAIVGSTAFMALGVTGAVVCFALTVAYYAIQGAIELAQTENELAEISNELYFLRTPWSLEGDPDNPAESQRLNTPNCLKANLKRHDLEQRMAYLKALTRYQYIKLVQSVMVQSMIPVLVFVAFMFLPMGAGVGALAGGLALMLLTNWMVERFKPDALDNDLKSTAQWQELEDIPKLGSDSKCRLFQTPPYQEMQEMSTENLSKPKN